MNEISKIPKTEIKAVFTDLDDTLTLNSKLSAETFESLWRLQKEGFWVVIVSGRPAGWADCLMRLWPIDAMIFENGAGLLIKEGEKFKTINLADPTESEAQRAALQDIFDELKARIPHLKLASDQPYRLFDFAIDFAEDEPFLSDSELDEVLKRLAREKEMTAKLSSIHVNYWWGRHTKVTACEYLISNMGTSRGVARDNVVFVGDSPNDEPLFKFFDYSVGVSNIKKYLDKLSDPPKYLCKQPGGQGFVELVKALL